jgi:hypothetical protein
MIKQTYLVNTKTNSSSIIAPVQFLQSGDGCFRHQRESGRQTQPRAGPGIALPLPRLQNDVDFVLGKFA